MESFIWNDFNVFHIWFVTWSRIFATAISMNELFELRDGLMSNFEAARAAKKIEKRRGKKILLVILESPGWWFQIVLEFSPLNLGKIPILTIIFFKWVGSTTNVVSLSSCLREWLGGPCFKSWLLPPHSSGKYSTEIIFEAACAWWSCMFETRSQLRIAQAFVSVAIRDFGQKMTGQCFRPKHKHEQPTSSNNTASICHWQLELLETQATWHAGKQMKLWFGDNDDAERRHVTLWHEYVTTVTTRIQRPAAPKNTSPGWFAQLSIL